MQLAPDPHALVFAPRGRDAALAKSLSREAGVGAEICATLAGLEATLGPHTTFVVMAEEPLRFADLRPLRTWVEGQPTWSDLPFILLTMSVCSPQEKSHAHL